jgi:hypothetical protein
MKSFSAFLSEHINEAKVDPATTFFAEFDIKNAEHNLSALVSKITGISVVAKLEVDTQREEIKSIKSDNLADKINIKLFKTVSLRFDGRTRFDDRTNTYYMSIGIEYEFSAGGSGISEICVVKVDASGKIVEATNHLNKIAV